MILVAKKKKMNVGTMTISRALKEAKFELSVENCWQPVNNSVSLVIGIPVTWGQMVPLEAGCSSQPSPKIPCEGHSSHEFAFVRKQMSK